MPAVDRTLCQAGHVPQKPPSWNEIRHNLTEFSAEWGAETREHAEYASFWDALLRCYGVERRRVATFQQQAKRASTGNSGFIDFFWPKVAIGEHKSLGKAGVEGQDAEDQAFDYLAGGSIDPADFPRYVISTDFATIRVTDLDADGGPASSYFPITDLRDHAEELGFLGGYQSAAIETSDPSSARPPDSGRPSAARSRRRTGSGQRPARSASPGRRPTARA